MQHSLLDNFQNEDEVTEAKRLFYAIHQAWRVIRKRSVKDRDAAPQEVMIQKDMMWPFIFFIKSTFGDRMGEAIFNSAPNTPEDDYIIGHAHMRLELLKSHGKKLDEEGIQWLKEVSGDEFFRHQDAYLP